MTERRVFWNPTQAAEVIHRAAELIVHSNYNELHAMRQASEEMPEPLRRPIRQLQKVRTLLEPLRDEVAKQMAELEALTAPAPAPAPEPEPVVEPEPEPTPAPVKRARKKRAPAPAPESQPEPIPPAPAAPAVDPLAGSLFEGLKALVLQVLQSPEGHAAIAAALAAQRQAQAAAPAQATVTVSYASEKKPRVLIVGALPVQAASIHQQFSDRLRLEFLLASDSGDRMRAHAKSADYTFSLRSYISTTSDKLLLKCSKRYERISGAGDMLSTAITRMLNQREIDRAKPENYRE